MSKEVSGTEYARVIKSKLESCMELDQLCCCIMQEVKIHHAVEHSDHVGLLPELRQIVEATSKFHEKLKVIHQAELGKTN